MRWSKRWLWFWIIVNSLAVLMNVTVIWYGLTTGDGWPWQNLAFAWLHIILIYAIYKVSMRDLAFLEGLYEDHLELERLSERLEFLRQQLHVGGDEDLPDED